MEKSRFLEHSPSLPKGNEKGKKTIHTQDIINVPDFVFLTGCAIGLDKRKGILIGGHHVSLVKLPSWEVHGNEFPSNGLNNDQVLEVDITDMKNWKRSNVPLKKVM